MKYIKTFEDLNPSKFLKIVPIQKGDKTIYRKQPVGSTKNFTNQYFLYLEKIFGTKLDAYKQWLLSIYPLNYYSDKDLFVDNNLNVYRLFPIDQAYRKKLIKEMFPGIQGQQKIKATQNEIRTKYVDSRFANKDVDNIDAPVIGSHVKGAKKGSPVNLKEHPFMREIVKAANPPKDIETANIISGTEIGNDLINKKEKEKNINDFFQKSKINQIINEFNLSMSEINYLYTTPFELYEKLHNFKNKSNGIINDDSVLNITTLSGKIGKRTLKQLMNYLRVSEDKLNFTKIEINI